MNNFPRFDSKFAVVLKRVILLYLVILRGKKIMDFGQIFHLNMLKDFSH